MHSKMRKNKQQKERVINPTLCKLQPQGKTPKSTKLAIMTQQEVIFWRSLLLFNRTAEAIFSVSLDGAESRGIAAVIWAALCWWEFDQRKLQEIATCHFERTTELVSKYGAKKVLTIQNLVLFREQTKNTL